MTLIAPETFSTSAVYSHACVHTRKRKMWAATRVCARLTLVCYALRVCISRPFQSLHYANLSLASVFVFNYLSTANWISQCFSRYELFSLENKSKNATLRLATPWHYKSRKKKFGNISLNFRIVIAKIYYRKIFINRYLSRDLYD